MPGENSFAEDLADKGVIGAVFVVIALGVGFCIGSCGLIPFARYGDVAASAVSVSPSEILPRNEGRVVLVTGRLSAKAPAVDPKLDLRFPGAVLVTKNVELDRGRGDTQSLSYDSFASPKVRLGAFELDTGWLDSLSLNHETHDVLPESYRHFRMIDGYLYPRLRRRRGAPARRISYRALPSGTELTVLAVQKGQRLASFDLGGEEAHFLRFGKSTALEMMNDEQGDLLAKSVVVGVVAFIGLWIGMLLLVLSGGAKRVSKVVAWMRGDRDAMKSNFPLFLALNLSVLMGSLGLACLLHDVRPRFSVELVAAAVLCIPGLLAAGRVSRRARRETHAS